MAYFGDHTTKDCLRHKQHVSKLVAAVLQQADVSECLTNDGKLVVRQLMDRVRSIRTGCDVQIADDCSGAETYRCMLKEIESVGGDHWDLISTLQYDILLWLMRSGECACVCACIDEPVWVCIYVYIIVRSCLHETTWNIKKNRTKTKPHPHQTKRPSLGNKRQEKTAYHPAPPKKKRGDAPSQDGCYLLVNVVQPRVRR